MAILVTGGAGYIGSHTVLELLNKGYEVIVVDNLSTSKKHHDLSSVRSYTIDICNLKDLLQVFTENHVESVIHLAASSLVDESTKDPLDYYRNNVLGSVNLIRAMIMNNVYNIVFSSTSAVYGDTANSTPLSETSMIAPDSPYADTKLIVEKLLASCNKAYGINSILLRYFNAAGASPEDNIGEDRINESHLIPNVLDSILNNSTLDIYGNDYNTIDGTCIRDYIHVIDIARAHLLSLEKLDNFNGSQVINLGSGKGFSVMQVIKEIEQVTGKKVNYRVSNRREGDSATLTSSSLLAREFLDWEPIKSDLNTILQSTWIWQQKKER